ncbi:MAG: DUF1850 domain-containing protein [Sphaerochaeta sp.]|uniref:DUF1850 domain-containing protein n=1 Tax=Sphaerochaeta sp. TaxID=1972642 RepID=UPI002FC963A1
MKKRAWWIISSAVLTLVVGTLLFLNIRTTLPHMVLRDQKTQKVLRSVSVEAGDTVVFHWIHSFEHIPWDEEYTVENGNIFVLHTIKVAGFGAGIPENKGRTTVENGMVVMRSINQTFSEIHWIHSQTALQSITIQGKPFITGQDVPHHVPVELTIQGL